MRLYGGAAASARSSIWMADMCSPQPRRSSATCGRSESGMSNAVGVALLHTGGAALHVHLHHARLTM